MNEPMNTNPSLTRRHILAGAAVIGAGLVAAACGSDTSDANAPSDSTASSTGSSGTTAPSNAGTTAPTGSEAPDMSVDLKVALEAGDPFLDAAAIDLELGFTWAARPDPAGLAGKVRPHSR